VGTEQSCRVLLQLFGSSRAPQTGSGTSRAIIPLKPKEGLTPISCHAVLERSACAPFIKERRMECINATRLRRKSGQMGHPAVVAGLAKTIVGFARLFRPTYALANVGHPSCSREFCQYTGPAGTGLDIKF
jgi:hypothetical protein